jgi:hypothetical protein
MIDLKLYGFDGHTSISIGQISNRIMFCRQIRHRHNQGHIHGFGLLAKKAKKKYIILTALNQRFSVKLVRCFGVV